MVVLFQFDGVNVKLQQTHHVRKKNAPERMRLARFGSADHQCSHGCGLLDLFLSTIQCLNFHPSLEVAEHVKENPKGQHLTLPHDPESWH